MSDKFINEQFVDELLKSGVWDIARVDRGSRDEELISEDEEKGYPAEEAEEKGNGKKFKKENGNGKKSKKSKKKGDEDDEEKKEEEVQEESVSARDLAEELYQSLSEDVILEFIDLLYQNAINEDSEEESEEESEDEDVDEDSEEEDLEETSASTKAQQRARGTRGPPGGESVGLMAMGEPVGVQGRRQRTRGSGWSQGQAPVRPEKLPTRKST